MAKAIIGWWAREEPIVKLSITNTYWEINKGAQVDIGTRHAAGTASATSKTADELKALAETLGNAYKEDTNNINDGYPILSWQ